MPKSLNQFLEQVPTADVVRSQIAENLRQGKLLKTVLRIAEQREAVQEVQLKLSQEPSKGKGGNR